MRTKSKKINLKNLDSRMKLKTIESLQKKKARKK